jgi:hypothetical protein
MVLLPKVHFPAAQDIQFYIKEFFCIPVESKNCIYSTFISDSLYANSYKS